MAKEPEMSKEEQVGFHKGSLSTLAKERTELMKMLSIVEQLMQLHVEELKKLGVDLEAQAKELQKEIEKAKKSGKNIDEMLK